MISMLLPQRLTEKKVLLLGAYFCCSTVRVRNDAESIITESDQSSQLASDRIFRSTTYKIKARGLRSTRVSTEVSSVTRNIMY